MSIPQHVAIIMDGNGRWAKQQGKERTHGHYHGAINIRNIAIKAHQMGVKVLTLFAFSTENWKRPENEVSFIMDLPRVFLNDYLQELLDNHICIQFIGEWEKLPTSTVKICRDLLEKTKKNEGLKLVLAINYGAKSEIVHAVNEFITHHPQMLIDEELLEAHLYTSHLPPVDLCIRTSGEKRLSNFLLWQLAYSELVFCPLHWPEFTQLDFENTLIEFEARHRRYGGL
jgi:undecaprenyl diphosphate synthase